MSMAAVAADRNNKRDADPLGMELIGIEFKGPVGAVSHATYRASTAKSGAHRHPDGQETGKQTGSGYLVRPVFEPKQEASGTRRCTPRSELGPLPLPRVKPRFNRIHHHRGERDVPIERVLANALMKIDRSDGSTFGGGAPRPSRAGEALPSFRDRVSVPWEVWARTAVRSLTCVRPSQAMVRARAGAGTESAPEPKAFQTRRRGLCRRRKGLLDLLWALGLRRALGQGAAECGDAGASQSDAVTHEIELEGAAALGELACIERGLSEAFCPEGRHGAMGRTGGRVLINAEARGEEPPKRNPHRPRLRGP